MGSLCQPDSGAEFVQPPASSPRFIGTDQRRYEFEHDARFAEVYENSVVRVSTSLITVPAVVMDRNGRYVGNLRKEQFQIFEDGIEQKITYFASIEKPFTVALMLDMTRESYSLVQSRERISDGFTGRHGFAPIHLCSSVICR
jgi:hypothetical protein